MSRTSPKLEIRNTKQIPRTKEPMTETSVESGQVGTDLRGLYGRTASCSAPKGRNISAQGKRGGVGRQAPPWVRWSRERSPERAIHADINPPLVLGLRCGLGRRDACFALSGLAIRVSRYPGRRCACPGLICRAPSGLRPQVLSRGYFSHDCRTSLQTSRGASETSGFEEFRDSNLFRISRFGFRI
jgi:hypothetical protein